MSVDLTTSELILDKLAEGRTFSELSGSHGYTREDFLTAALFGVAELQAEYLDLLEKYGRFSLADVKKAISDTDTKMA